MHGLAGVSFGVGFLPAEEVVHVVIKEEPDVEAMFGSIPSHRDLRVVWVYIVKSLSFHTAPSQVLDSMDKTLAVSDDVGPMSSCC